MQAIFWFLCALPTAFAAVLVPQNTSVACNNSPDLCSRSYSRITHLGAHDSPFLRDASTRYSQSGNQNINTTRQLDAGVRLLTAQVHNQAGVWRLCHSSCALLDAGTLSAWLVEIKTWMDRNPSDVVTILLVNSDNASAADLHTQFQAAGIVPYAYTPPSGATAIATWPTLTELIAQSTRLITFVASLDQSTNTVAPYLLNEFDFVFENPYEVTSLSGFSCIPDRPSAVKGDPRTAVQSGRLPLMNHFKYEQQGFGILAPDISNITITNAKSGPQGNLGDAATECQTLYGRAPSFILVDFFDQGSAIDTVDRLNNIKPVGRITPPPTVVQSLSSSDGVGRSDVVKGVLKGGLLRWNGCMGLLIALGSAFAFL